MVKGGIFGSALLLAVTTMGAGILTLPSAFSNAGVIPAMGILIFVALITIVSIDYMVICIDKLGVNSYEQINRELLGKFNEELVRWMLLFYNIGSAISYLVVLGDLFEPLQPLISEHFPWLATTKHTLFIFWFFVILPFSCVPDISFLHIASVIAISATCFISSLVVFRYFIPSTGSNSNISPGVISSPNEVHSNILWFQGKQPLLSLPIMMFSFDCQSLVFQIYSNLHEMNRMNMMQVSIVSLIVSGTIHAAVGLFGYLGHPNDVRENVMSNFDPRTDYLFAIGYLVYAIPVNLSFVLILFPTRDAIFLMWYGYSAATEAAVAQHHHYNYNIDNDMNGGIEEYDTFSKRKEIITIEENEKNEKEEYHQEGGRRIPLRDHFIVSAALSVACVTAALIAPGIVSVVALLGGVCSSTLCFTYPALYRLRLQRVGLAPWENDWQRVIAFIMLGFGVIGGLLGTVVAIMEFF